MTEDKIFKNQTVLIRGKDFRDAPKIISFLGCGV